MFEALTTNTPAIPNPDKSTQEIVEGVLERAMEVYPDDLALRICSALGSEGKFAW